MPWSGFCHTFVAHSACARMIGHSRCGKPLAPSCMDEDRVEDGAVDVVLPLVERAVADPDRTRPCIAGEFVERRFRQIAATVDPVHDLQRAVLVRLDVGDELHELVGLPVQVQVVERLEGERRVAHPRVPVVPVAFSARRLGERRRERRNRGAGRHVRQSLDRKRRALDRVAPAVVRDARPAEPRAPEPDRRRQPRFRVLDALRASRAPPPRRARSTPCHPLAGHAVPAPAALDAEREIRSEANRLPGSRCIGHVTIAVNERPRRRLAAVGEDGSQISSTSTSLLGTRPSARACGPRRRRRADECAA